MALASGTRLGSYEVTGPLGEGGMGVVYRARDVKLGRDVALKVLPESFARDPDRLARFQREAHVLASLNHPHIGAIYGFEDTDGVHALVLELVEGPTLADRIAQGPIPLDEALPIARQMAEALEAAHEQGIVHRDLKPANIKLRPDGTVKVLDFGLAKAMEPAGVLSASVTQSPTITSPAMMTGVGVLLGTAAYMSPEQAKGRPADKRSDIWAFGAVLFEMLTGKRAFEGDDVGDTLANVLRGDVDWGAFPPNVPPHVRAIVRGCLVKDRAKRIPDISAIRFLMNAEEQAPAPSESRAPSAWSKGRWLATAGAGIAVGAAIAAGVGLLLARRPTPNPAPIRFTVAAPPNAAFGTAAGSPAMSFSPDGRHLAFVIPQTRGSESGLWIRSLDALDARGLPGTRGAAGVPFWSPDGRHVGFFADRKLKKIDVASGLTSTLCETPAMFGATWNQHGDILFSNGVGILRVPSSGGAPTVVITPDRSREEREHRWPQFLPDGSQFLYLSLATTNSTIVAASLNSPTGKPLGKSDSKALYASPGFLVFARQGSLFAQPFDAARAAISGEAVPIAEGMNAARGASSFAVSESGVLAFRHVGIGMAELAWFDRAGKALGRVAEAAPYIQVSLSPDGKQIAAQRGSGDSAEIWLIDAARGVASRFKEGAGVVWSPNSVDLAYYDARSRSIVRTARDGTKDKTFTGIVEDWSKDGRYLVYLNLDEGVDIWALALDDLKPIRITETPAAEDEPALSPDGHWLAYMSPESGRPEIYIRPFPPKPGNRTTRISTNGGHQPKWRGDGRELFFLTPGGAMMAVDINGTGAAMEPGAPHALFQTGINVNAIVDQYAVTADGQKFLVIVPSGDATESPITVVVNWTAGLRR